MNFNHTIEYLTDRLLSKLPGLKAQLNKAPGDISHNVKRYKKPVEARQSAVTLLLYENNRAESDVILIKRAEYNGSHSGQIGFPGGKEENDDASLLHTALRETKEEIGLHEIHVLGSLSPLFIPVSNFNVNPFIGYLTEKPNFVLDPREVQEVLTIPLKHLLDVDNELVTHKKLNGTKYRIPYYHVHEHMLWGASAMIMSEFLALFNTKHTI